MPVQQVEEGLVMVVLDGTPFTKEKFRAPRPNPNTPPGQGVGADEPKLSNWFHAYHRGADQSAFCRGGAPDSHTEAFEFEEAKLSDSPAMRELARAKHKGGRGGRDFETTGNFEDLRMHKYDRRLYRVRDGTSYARYAPYALPSFPAGGVDFYVDDAAYLASDAVVLRKDELEQKLGLATAEDDDKSQKAVRYASDASGKRLRYPIVKPSAYKCNGVKLVRERGANMGIGAGNEAQSRMPPNVSMTDRTYANYEQLQDPDGKDGCGHWIPGLRQGLAKQGGQPPAERPSTLRYDAFVQHFEEVVRMAGNVKDVFGRKLGRVGPDDRYYPEGYLPCDVTPVSSLAAMDQMCDGMGSVIEFLSFVVDEVVQVSIRRFQQVPQDANGAVYANLGHYTGKFALMEYLKEAACDMVHEVAFGRKLMPIRAAGDSESDARQCIAMEQESIKTPVTAFKTIGSADGEEDAPAVARAKAFFLELTRYISARNITEEERQKNPRMAGKTDAQLEAMEEKEMTECIEWLQGLVTEGSGWKLPVEDYAYLKLFAGAPQKDDQGREMFPHISGGYAPDALMVRLHASIHYMAVNQMAWVSREFFCQSWKLCKEDHSSTTLHVDDDARRARVDEHNRALPRGARQLLVTDPEAFFMGCAEPLTPEVFGLFQQAKVYAFTFPDACDFYRNKELQDNLAFEYSRDQSLPPYFSQQNEFSGRVGQQTVPSQQLERDGLRYELPLSTLVWKQLQAQSSAFTEGQPFLPTGDGAVTKRTFNLRESRVFLRTKTELDEMWLRIEPGVHPSFYDFNSSDIAMKRYQTAGGLPYRAGDLSAASPSQLKQYDDVGAPWMPMPQLHWLNTQGNKKMLVGLKPDHYDVDFEPENLRNRQARDAADVNSLFYGTPDGFALVPLFTLRTTRQRLEASRLMPLMPPITEVPAHDSTAQSDGIRRLQDLVVDYDSMLDRGAREAVAQAIARAPQLPGGNWGNVANLMDYNAGAGISQVVVQMPRRPVFGESMYNYSLLAIMRELIASKAELGNYTQDRERALLHLTPVPSKQSSRAGATPNVAKVVMNVPEPDIDESRWLKSIQFGDGGAGSTYNSNSLFMRQVTYWMYNKGITRCARLPVNETTQKNRFVKYTRLHTAFPEPWQHDRFQTNNLQLKWERPDARIKEALDDINFEFSMNMYERVMFHARVPVETQMGAIRRFDPTYELPPLWRAPAEFIAYVNQFSNKPKHATLFTKLQLAHKIKKEVSEPEPQKDNYKGKKVGYKDSGLFRNNDQIKEHEKWWKDDVEARARYKRPSGGFGIKYVANASTSTEDARNGTLGPNGVDWLGAPFPGAGGVGYDFTDVDAFRGYVASIKKALGIANSRNYDELLRQGCFQFQRGGSTRADILVPGAQYVSGWNGNPGGLVHVVSVQASPAPGRWTPEVPDVRFNLFKTLLLTVSGADPLWNFLSERANVGLAAAGAAAGAAGPAAAGAAGPAAGGNANDETEAMGLTVATPFYPPSVIEWYYHRDRFYGLASAYTETLRVLRQADRLLFLEDAPPPFDDEAADGNQKTDGTRFFELQHETALNPFDRYAIPGSEPEVQQLAIVPGERSVVSTNIPDMGDGIMDESGTMSQSTDALSIVGYRTFQQYLMDARQQWLTERAEVLKAMKPNVEQLRSMTWPLDQLAQEPADQAYLPNSRNGWSFAKLTEQGLLGTEQTPQMPLEDASNGVIVQPINFNTPLTDALHGKPLPGDVAGSFDVTVQEDNKLEYFSTFLFEHPDRMQLGIDAVAVDGTPTPEPPYVTPNITLRGLLENRLGGMTGEAFDAAWNQMINDDLAVQDIRQDRSGVAETSKGILASKHLCDLNKTIFKAKVVADAIAAVLCRLRTIDHRAKQGVYPNKPINGQWLVAWTALSKNLTGQLYPRLTNLKVEFFAKHSRFAGCFVPPRIKYLTTRMFDGMFEPPSSLTEPLRTEFPKRELWAFDYHGAVGKLMYHTYEADCMLKYVKLLVGRYANDRNCIFALAAELAIHPRDADKKGYLIQALERLKFQLWPLDAQGELSTAHVQAGSTACLVVHEMLLFHVTNIGTGQERSDTATTQQRMLRYTPVDRDNLYRRLGQLLLQNAQSPSATNVMSIGQFMHIHGENPVERDKLVEGLQRWAELHMKRGNKERGGAEVWNTDAVAEVRQAELYHAFAHETTGLFGSHLSQSFALLAAMFGPSGSQVGVALRHLRPEERGNGSYSPSDSGSEEEGAPSTPPPEPPIPPPGAGRDPDNLALLSKNAWHLLAGSLEMSALWSVVVTNTSQGWNPFAQGADVNIDAFVAQNVVVETALHKTRDYRGLEQRRATLKQLLALQLKCIGNLEEFDKTHIYAGRDVADINASGKIQLLQNGALQGNERNRLHRLLLESEFVGKAANAVSKGLTSNAPGDPDDPGDGALGKRKVSSGGMGAAKKSKGKGKARQVQQQAGGGSSSTEPLQRQDPGVLAEKQRAAIEAAREAQTPTPSDSDSAAEDAAAAPAAAPAANPVDDGAGVGVTGPPRGADSIVQQSSQSFLQQRQQRAEQRRKEEEASLLEERLRFRAGEQHVEAGKRARANAQEVEKAKIEAERAKKRADLRREDMLGEEGGAGPSESSSAATTGITKEDKKRATELRVQQQGSRLYGLDPDMVEMAMEVFESSETLLDRLHAEYNPVDGDVEYLNTVDSPENPFDAGGHGVIGFADKDVLERGGASSSGASSSAAPFVGGIPLLGDESEDEGIESQDAQSELGDGGPSLDGGDSDGSDVAADDDAALPGEDRDYVFTKPRRINPLQPKGGTSGTVERLIASTMTVGELQRIQRVVRAHIVREEACGSMADEAKSDS